MTLASCKNNAAWVSMTWDETAAYDRWRVASYTVENRLSYIVPNNYKVHPDEITVLLVC